MPERTDSYQGPGFYRHYKGGEYEVVGLGLEEATRRPVVVYRPLAGWPADVPEADFWTRPLDDFNAILSDGTVRFRKLARPAALPPRRVQLPGPSCLASDPARTGRRWLRKSSAN